jgi:murein DD-endopeptidase MepM/ murein hydrolase activator NlpD
MSVIGNIKAMSSGVSGLTKEVNSLNAAVKTLQSTSSTTFKSVNGLLNGGGQKNLGRGVGAPTIMSSSLSSFSTPTYAPGSMASKVSNVMTGASNRVASKMGFETSAEKITDTSASGEKGGDSGRSGIIKMIGGALQIASAPLQGAYAAAMPTEGIVNRAGMYYQATLRAGIGTSRAGVEAATFKALTTNGSGITGIGSDAQVANILAGAGFTAGPNNKNYLSAVAQVGGAAKYLAMDNSAAAAAIAGLQSGKTAANMYQYGITTMNANGTMKSEGEIAKQIMKTFAPTDAKGNSLINGKKLTAESINMSYLKGNLKPILEGLGLSPHQQQMIVQSMQDISQGKNPDLSTKTTKSAGKSKNENPYDALYRSDASQTNVQMYSERNALRGLAASATLIETFNSSMKTVIQTMALVKGGKEGLMDSNAGRGMAKTAQVFKDGVMNLVDGLLKFLHIGGGGTPGYGGSFTQGPRGGGTPSLNVSPVKKGNISAVFGETGSIWASTGNTHQGVDYDVPVGTPVYSVGDGIVSLTTLNPDYGQAIMIDHPNGFSTVYAHLSNKEVSPGTPVYKGTEIGKSGKSGNTTGPSLHYEVRRGLNNVVNPATFPNSGSPLTTNFSNDSPSTLSSNTLSYSSQASNSGSDLSPSAPGTPGSSKASVGVGLNVKGFNSVYNFLLGKGFTKDATLGILGNFVQESNLRPNAEGDRGYTDANGKFQFDQSYPPTSFGIAQWHYSRWDNLKAFAAKRNLDPATIEVQQEFLWSELKNYTGLVKDFRNPKTTTFGASKEFLVKFERGLDVSDKASQYRADLGISAYKHATEKAPTTSVKKSTKPAKGGGTPGYGASMPETTVYDSNTAQIIAPATSMYGNAPNQILAPAINSGSKTVNITVKFDNANEANAIKFAKQIQMYLEEKNNISMIGKS